MSKLKLYTENDLRKAIQLSNQYATSGDNPYSFTRVKKYFVDDIINSLTPIELPSDEEIDEIGKDVIVYNDTKRGWFIEGAKWMRDKIK